MVENRLLGVLIAASVVKSKKWSWKLANRVVSGSPPWRIIDALPVAELGVKSEYIVILASWNRIFCVYFAHRGVF